MVGYTLTMARDAAATRARLLQAATQEFAANGIAGARIDRIAEAAGCNKQLIYAYFESKDGLFDAVFEAMVLRAVEEVPMDVTDLPGYAGRLFDGYREHANTLRLATWHRLERMGAEGPHPAAIRSMLKKADAIRDAQKRGVISDRFPPEDLLLLILSMAAIGSPESPESPAGVTEPATLRSSLVKAVSLLVDKPTRR